MASPTQSCFESACAPIATDTSPRSSRCVCYDASRRMGVFPWIFQYEIRHVLHSEKRMSTVKSVGPTRRADAEAARAGGRLRPRSAQQHGLRARAPCRPGWCGCQPTPRTVRPHARGRVPCPQHLSAAFPQGSHAALAFFLSCGVNRERGGRALTPGPTEPLACPSLSLQAQRKWEASSCTSICSWFWGPSSAPWPPAALSKGNPRNRWALGGRQGCVNHVGRSLP